MLLLGTILSFEVFAAGYYICQDPKTGKKTGQDFPCQSSKELGNYAPVSPDEIRTREESAKAGKRAFERQHPGTYRPEEYMSEDELAAYQVTHKKQEEERRKREEDRALQEALQRSERAEQRAIEAERAAREAQSKAAAAEEAARNRPLIYPVPIPMAPPMSSRITTCDRAGCQDENGMRYSRRSGNIMIGPTGPCRQVGGYMRCP